MEEGRRGGVTHVMMTKMALCMGGNLDPAAEGIFLTIVIVVL